MSFLHEDLDIVDLRARQIIDSRGNPTIETEILLAGGGFGRSNVPSGASTGAHEAHELRDNNPALYNGKSVLNAINNIHSEIYDAIIGLNAKDQSEIDDVLLKLDNSDNKANLGANAILSISLAVARAAADGLSLPLYEYLGGMTANLIPVPMMNIINGGSHADNKIDIQEFMIIPAGFNDFSQALMAGVEVFHKLKSLLQKDGFSTNVGDEGGFAPSLSSNIQALDYIAKAIDGAGYKLNQEIYLALDVASSEFYQNGKYLLASENKSLSTDEFIAYLIKMQKDYHILSIEDPLHEDDWQGYSNLSQQIGKNCQIVGDDLFVTNEKRLIKGIEEKCANSILIKPNQIGTLSETIKTVKTAQSNNFTTIMSHRSGETEDNIIADLAVGLNCGQIKTGSLSRSDRTAKYNQLLRIEEEKTDCLYAGEIILKKFNRV